MVVLLHYIYISTCACARRIKTHIFPRPHPSPIAPCSVSPPCPHVWSGYLQNAPMPGPPEGPADVGSPSASTAASTLVCVAALSAAASLSTARLLFPASTTAATATDTAAAWAAAATRRRWYRTHLADPPLRRRALEGEGDDTTTRPLLLQPDDADLARRPHIHAAVQSGCHIKLLPHRTPCERQGLVDSPAWIRRP